MSELIGGGASRFQGRRQTEPLLDDTLTSSSGGLLPAILERDLRVTMAVVASGRRFPCILRTTIFHDIGIRQL